MKMKNLIIIIITFISASVFAQSPKVDTLKFKDNRGKLFKCIVYKADPEGPGSDSINMNGVMFFNGFKYKSSAPNVLRGASPGSLIGYEGIRGINGSGPPRTNRLVIYQYTDKILYALDSAGGGSPMPDNFVLDYLQVQQLMAWDSVNRVPIPVTFPAGISSNESVKINSDKYFCLGDTTANGSWRISISGQSLIFERRETGTWNVLGGFNQP